MCTSRRVGRTVAALVAAAIAVLAAPAAHAAAPVVAFTAPASGSTLAGTATVSANASDADGIAAVEFRVDGALIVRDTAAPYAVAWNTTTVANGSRRLAAAAFDKKGNRTTVTRTVTVANLADTTPPTVAFGSPASGATISGTIAITATASDTSGVASVRFAVDGQTLSIDPDAPYTHGGWDTTTVPDGLRTLSLIATDTRGNSTTVTRQVTVANPVPDTSGPTVAFTAPGAGATLAGAVTIAATADDPSGVASVRFAVDGQTLSIDPDAPYTHGGWDTTTVADGDHTLALTATDAAGNTTTVARAVVVANTPPDTDGPELEITAPAAAAEVWGAVDITAAASDPGGVESVRFAVDGEVLSTDTSAPWAHRDWDATAPVDGPREITVTATDGLGNVTVRTRVVNSVGPAPDLTPPDVALTAPADGVTVSGLLDIRATAEDAHGVAEVRFVVGGAELSVDASAPYVHPGWDTAVLADGPQLVEVVATDTAGNAARASATVIVERPPPDLAGPALELTSPAGDEGVTGIVAIAVVADDPAGVTGVELAIDGTPWGTDDVAPYSWDWDTAGLEPGSAHTIEVAATDVLGNRSALSRAVTIGPPPAPPPATGPLPGTPVMRGDFETGDLSQFRTVQRAAVDRLQVVSSPVAEGAWAGRFEVRKGDTAASGTRTEVIAGPNVREGDERWYEWRTMFAADYPSITTGYQIVGQWHATAGGSQPMIVVYASGDQIGFKTVASGADLKPSPSVVHWRGPMDRGSWHTFRMRVRWSSDPANGLVEFYRDGLRVVAPTPLATLIPGYDAYMKVGIYRSSTHEPPAVVFHDGLLITAVG